MLCKSFVEIQLHHAIFSKKANLCSSSQVFTSIHDMISANKRVNRCFIVERYELHEKYSLRFNIPQVEGIRMNKGWFRYIIWKESFDCLYQFKSAGLKDPKIDVIRSSLISRL